LQTGKKCVCVCGGGGCHFEETSKVVVQKCAYCTYTVHMQMQAVHSMQLKKLKTSKKVKKFSEELEGI